MKRILLLIVIAFFFIGCGLSNVVNKGEYIEQTSIEPDIPRKELLARYGSPIDTQEDKNGCKIDVFRCPQGDKTSGKVVKGLGILAADILTLGLTEIIFTPVTDGKKYVTFEVIYNKNEKVKEVRFITK